MWSGSHDECGGISSTTALDEMTNDLLHCLGTTIIENVSSKTSLNPSDFGLILERSRSSTLMELIIVYGCLIESTEHDPIEVRLQQESGVLARELSLDIRLVIP